MTKRTWYVVRTAPGAQLPQREYSVESTSLDANGRPRGKGYRLVPSLNPNISAIERALKDNGFTCYMPVEKRLVRDRRKLGLWKPRRFAILIGYVFVADVDNFPLLEETPGVAGIVGIHGKPLVLPAKDMAQINEIEDACEVAYQKELSRRQAVEERNLLASMRPTRAKTKSLFPSGSVVTVTNGLLSGRDFIVKGTDRDGRLRAMEANFNALGEISLPVNDVKLVA